jgi:putative pyruvate formate lyase activating enzyme
MFEPAYLRTLESGQLSLRVSESFEMLRNCAICPRNCKVDRIHGQRGFCNTGSLAAVSSANPHFGEESPLVGSGGSGTIFFTSCNLKCVFCQNYEISHLMDGEEFDAPALGQMMLRLQSMGCHNINLVTPTHQTAQILAAVKWASEKGLRVPLVYNTGGYDSVETLMLLDGVIDIYMPDIKFMDPKISLDLIKAEDYPVVVKAAVVEMHRQVGDLRISESGLAERGLLVRHLVMPNEAAGTQEAMRFLTEKISPNTYVNIMDQYRPCGQAKSINGINRRTSRQENLEALEMAREEGITRLDDRVPFRANFF